ncbi:hypothetical protein O181_044008 [Austropuccinia psidii MF-1]|uniref:Reverse transcriptase domain-containing protein n=1 Tax=Austropuccinia psidii MF-1 TaxID=1389203 RepID=A0A9Q3HG91_9BASI|nr:hypothetical protein [Austropuccinia psidii MF-1]
MVHMKILKKCGGELEHAPRRRCIEPCSTEEYINALEDIVTRTKIGRTWKNMDIKSPNKPFIKKDKPRETFKPNTSNSNEQRKCHKCGDIILNVEKPYPPLLRRPAYPANPRAREALEVHIKDLIDLRLFRKVGHDEQVEVTTPVIITWHNGKSRMVGDFRALNTNTIPDRYPIPRIHEILTQLSQAKFITAMDAPKGFHKNVLTDNAKELLRIIVPCRIFEYPRIPFGINNATSHYQRMMNTIFPEELSEGWLIIYIDDIIACSEAWDSHLSRIERVLQKIVQVYMKISLKNCHFAYSELKAPGNVVTGLSLGIDKNKLAAVL